MMNQVTRNIAVVKINPGYNTQAGVIERLIAEHPIVGTHIGTHPITSQVLRVGVYRFLPFLKRNVSFPQPVISEGDANVDFVFEVLGKIFGVLERYELAVGYIFRLGIG